MAHIMDSVAPRTYLAGQSKKGVLDGRDEAGQEDRLRAPIRPGGWHEGACAREVNTRYVDRASEARVPQSHASKSTEMTRDLYVPL